MAAPTVVLVRPFRGGFAIDGFAMCAAARFLPPGRGAEHEGRAVPQDRVDFGPIVTAGTMQHEARQQPERRAAAFHTLHENAVGGVARAGKQWEYRQGPEARADRC